MNPLNRLSRLLYVYAVLFAGFGLFILFLEESVFALLNLLQGALGFGSPMDAPAQPFWKYVTISLLWMLGILCVWAARDVAGRREMVQLVIYAKFFSGLLLIGHFLIAGRITPYLLGGLTDSTLGVILLICFARAFPGSLGRIARLSP